MKKKYNFLDGPYLTIRHWTFSGHSQVSSYAIKTYLPILFRLWKML